MKIIPILPIWLLIIITIIELIYIIKHNKNIIEILIIILIFIINLRPVIIKNKNPNLNILFVVDTSINMNKKINNKSRLNLAKENINYIIKKIKYSNISLITYNNYSKIVIPYTYDYEYFKTTVNNLKTIDKTFSEKDSPDIPYKTINNNLKYDDNNTIVIIMNCENKYINKNLNVKENIYNEIIFDCSNDLSNNKLDKIIKKINKLENKTNITSYEFYYLFVIPLLILITIDYKSFRSKTV